MAWGTAAKSRSSGGRGSCAPSRGRSRTSPPSSAFRSRACRCGSATSSSSRTRGDATHRTEDNQHPMHVAKLDEIERCTARGRRADRRAVRTGVPRPRAALYAGEGAKTQDKICFANSDPRLISDLCHVAAAILRRSTSRSSGSSSTSTKASTSTLQRMFWSMLTEIPHQPVRQAVPGGGRPHDPPFEARDGMSGSLLLVGLHLPPCDGSVAAVTSIEAIPG